jgi:hypothetical protein
MKFKDLSETFGKNLTGLIFGEFNALYIVFALQKKGLMSEYICGITGLV